MARPTAIDDLQRRARRARDLSIVAASLAVLALFMCVFLLQAGAGSGPGDVDIPPASHWLVEHGGLPAGEPHLAGGWITTLQGRVATVAHLVYGLAVIVFIWGLIKRRKRTAKIAFAAIVGISIFNPTNPARIFNPAVALPASTARSVMGLPAGGPLVTKTPPDAATRYMLAQIAYVEGDRRSAASFARGLDSGNLMSPIEAPFRLQFLQGRNQGLTTVCKWNGCLGESTRGTLSVLAWLLFALASAAAGSCLWFSLSLRRRCERVAELEAGRRLRRPLAA
ncbi:MAG: hypothetical protein JWO25_825 [Alphaproteobacteria bacterium]|nr:hypothetical protein [Alphaproteobacteria bacterium]